MTKLTQVFPKNYFARKIAERKWLKTLGRERKIFSLNTHILFSSLAMRPERNFKKADYLYILMSSNEFYRYRELTF